MLSSRPRRLKWTLIALLWLASFCVSIYVRWIPSPAERRLVGCWTIQEPDNDFCTLLHLKSDRRWSIWWRNKDFPDWQYDTSGRWSMNGDTIELRVGTGRRMQDYIASLFRDEREQLIILERGPDRMLTRSPDATRTHEWTRVAEDETPQIQNPGSASQ